MQVFRSPIASDLPFNAIYLSLGENPEFIEWAAERYAESKCDEAECAIEAVTHEPESALLAGPVLPLYYSASVAPTLHAYYAAIALLCGDVALALGTAVPGNESLGFPGFRFDRRFDSAKGLHAFAFLPISGSAAPIIAFQGTDFTSADNIADDLTWSGIGQYGITDEIRDEIVSYMEETLNERSETEARWVLLGHSLGGALAQRVALETIDMVERLVTYNSPGVGEDAVVSWEAAQELMLRNGVTPPEVWRVIHDRDAVALVGGRHLRPDRGFLIQPPVELGRIKAHRLQTVVDGLMDQTHVYEKDWGESGGPQSQTLERVRKVASCTLGYGAFVSGLLSTQTKAACSAVSTKITSCGEGLASGAKWADSKVRSTLAFVRE